VWAAMLALAWTGWRAWRSADADLARSRVGRRWRIAAFALGTIVLWAALDWPIGPLAAGYLASVHMAQFLIIALIVPPALLFGLPPADRPPNSRPSLRAGLRLVTHPLVAILLFNLVVVATHLPEVVDRSMRTQLGSFAIDVSWLLAGLILWWPVIRRFPERPGFSRPV
ncbi:MAG: hypothetical protein GWN71_42040, partial [Gammaproteobacteria bacterium]|nr:cytochrome c oxidase assembly protein [Gemmatimonadota bacterium]NIU79886.1 hypothetical protein [Gammaproteobacteria bacterium]NIX24791.1 hypothetical protein [Actinomycetota bacterium]